MKLELQEIRDLISSMPKLPEMGGVSQSGGQQAGQQGGGGGGAAGALKSSGNPYAAAAGQALEILSGVFEWVKGVAMEGADLLQQGANLAISMTGQRDATMGVLKKLLGSDKKAGQAYDKAVGLSRDLALDKEKTLTTLKKLISTGFSNKTSDRIIEEMANIDKARGAGQGQKLEMLLERMRSTGKTDSASLKMAAKQLGLSSDTIVSDLAKQLHKSNAEVTAMLKKGKVSAQAGIDEILALVDKKFGGLAKKAGESIPGLIAAIQDQLRSMFDSVDLGPLKAMLKEIKTLLNGTMGKELKGSISELFSSLFSALFGKIGDAGNRAQTIVNGITTAIRFVSDAIKVVIPVVRSFAEGILGSLFGAVGVINKPAKGGFLQDLRRDLPHLREEAKKFGEKIVAIGTAIWHAAGKIIAFGSEVAGVMSTIDAGLGKVFSRSSLLGSYLGYLGRALATTFYVGTIPLRLLIGYLQVVGSILGPIYNALKGPLYMLFNTITSFGQRLVNQVASVLSVARTIGSQLVTGIVNGITSGLSAVLGAIGNLASKAIGAAKAAFGIASPSRVFAEMGLQNTAGLVGGTQKGSKDVAAAYTKMSTGAIGAAKGATASGPTGGGGGTTVNIYLNGKQEASSKGGDDIEKAVQDGIRAYMRMRLQGA